VAARHRILALRAHRQLAILPLRPARSAPVPDFPPAYSIAIIGAASGIGRAAALLAGARGAAIACLDRDLAGAEASAASIRAAGGEAEAHGFEITDAGAQAPVWRTVLARRPLHAMVNCAGVTGKTNLKAHEASLADFAFVMQVNLTGALIASQAVLPHMLANNFGRILHIASIAGKDGNAGMTAYSASKAGLIGMVKSMGKDYAETGVTVNALAPAVIRTPMVAALPEATITYMTDKIPMKRCGTLEEAAEMILWIISPAASFTTGFTFDLSGGRAVY
jgi:2-dehydro-3-deoxy-L-rhamnonate dehydrogenase (NAD+)